MPVLQFKGEKRRSSATTTAFPITPWIHRDDLARFEQETRCKVRPMLVPFNLK